MKKSPTVLIIMDGYGVNERIEGNAICAANTPNIDRYFKEYKNSVLHASGMDVGLPAGQMGNSEVGHTNIGAGRIVYQELTRITKSITDGDFYENKAFVDAVNNCISNKSDLHIMGLLSDGGVHSHNEHLYALLRLAKKLEFSDVYVHCFLDGRDVSPTSGAGFVSDLIEQMRSIGVGRIATVTGRYYAMDRDNRWERVEKAYDAIVRGIGNEDTSAVASIEKSYNEGITDEFVKPTVITSDGKPTSVVKENDSVIFFNFRPDRAREITRTFTAPDFDGFKRDYFKTYFVCMTQYDANMPNVTVAYPPTDLSNTFGEYIAAKGLTQLRLAETEKYAHVTFFFNGGNEKPYENEERILINSPKVDTYDLKPEMSAYEVADAGIESIGKYDVIIMNFANCDMVGHTGVFEAAQAAVEAVDHCVGKVVAAVLEAGGRVLLTADHGNADQMLEYGTDKPFTAHTLNVVPLILISDETIKDIRVGRLSDIAPTMLDLLGLDKPSEMTGESLLER